MAYTEGQLSGSADFRVGINVWRMSSNNAGNYSTFGYEVHLTTPQQYGTYDSQSNQSWSASIGGQARSGSFKLTYENRYNNNVIVASGTVDISHHADGTRPGFASSAYISTNHSSVGSGGSGAAWVDAPRIAKRPGQPKGFKLSSFTDTTATFTWAYPDSDGGSAIQHYLIRLNTKSPADTAPYTDKTTAAGTMTFTGLAKGAKYYVTAYSKNNATWDNGGYSNKTTDIGFTTWDVPSAPGMPSVGTPTTTVIPLSWGEPSSNGGTAVTGYEVQRASNSGFTSGTSTSTFSGRSGNMGSLVSGTKYWFRVRALNAAGAGPWSGARETATLPGAPTGQNATNTTPSSHRISWSAPSGNGTIDYSMQFSTRSDFAGAPQGDDFNAQRYFDHTGLTPGVRYYYRVRAITRGGVGVWSSTFSITPGLPAPGTPTAATETTGEYAWMLKITWTAPSVTTALTGYRVQVAADSGFTTDVKTFDFRDQLTGYVGHKNGIVGGRRYYVRVAALTAGGVNTYSGVRSVVHRLDAGNIDGWSRVGTRPTNIEYYTSSGLRRGTVSDEAALWLESLSTGAATVTSGVLGIQKTVTGLKVGKAYRFEARATLGAGAVVNQYRLNVVSEAAAATVTVSGNTDLGFIEFVADATSAQLQVVLMVGASIAGAQSVVESIALHGVKLLELVTDYDQRLRETVFESTLANHLDMACNSVGASWYVDVAGDTRFRLPGASLPLSYTFSDTDRQGALHYVDATTAFDTRSLANRLEVTNYGVDAAHVNEQNDTVIVNSETSQALYGTRSTTLATNLYNVAPYADALTSRLAEVLDAADDASLLISSIRWNAQEDLSVARNLEVGQRVLVHFNGQEQDSQIVNITHEVTPERWMITLTLQRLA